MRFTLVWLAVIGLALGACSSSSDAVESALQDGFNTIPTPPDAGNNADNGTQGGVLDPNTMLEAKQLGSDVPALQDGEIYYGKYQMEFGKDLQAHLTGDNSAKVVDLEYIADSDHNIRMATGYTYALGSCDYTEEWPRWIEVDASGNILGEEELTFGGSIEAKEGSRYILRQRLTETSGCSQITIASTFEKF